MSGVILNKKRFVYDMYDGFEDEGESLDFSEVEDLLNRFDKDNKRLIKENNQFKHLLTFMANGGGEIDLADGNKIFLKDLKNIEVKKQGFVARKQLISISMELVDIKHRLIDLAEVLEDVSKD